MARLPTPTTITDLRFTADNSVAFELAWAGGDAYASMIDHLRVRFMLTNLEEVGAGITPAQVMTEMANWADTDIVADQATPAGWDTNLVIHQIGEDYDVADGTLDSPMDGTFTDDALRQRFVRCIVQARTAD